jgi:hypothetical protein
MMLAEDGPDHGLNSDPVGPGRRRNRAVLILSLASLGFAGGTATLAYQNGGLKRAIDRITRELDAERARRQRSEEIAHGAEKENQRLREENGYQEGIIDLQTRARKLAERRAKQAYDRALAERNRADAAEARAIREARRAEAAENRAGALEEDNRELRAQEEEAAERNLGIAIENLERLERALPEHAALEGDERDAWLRYDCSLLKRLKYDLNRGSSEELQGARVRRTALELEYEEACAEAQ